MYGSNINCLDRDRRTPLHYSAMEGRSKLIPALLQNGSAPGLKDINHKTAMDLAVTEKIRQLIIVYSPFNKFKPSAEAVEGLEIEGFKKPIKQVADLPRTDYYEPYEHAQPVKRNKSRKRINQKEGK